jgi:hypothetical protein
MAVKWLLSGSSMVAQWLFDGGLVVVWWWFNGTLFGIKIFEHKSNDLINGCEKNSQLDKNFGEKIVSR